MSYNYQALANTATRLLEKFGKPGRIIDSSKTTISSGTVVQGSLRTEANNSLAESADAVFFVEAGVTGAAIPNYLEVDSVVYKIVHAEPVKPGDTTMLTRVFVTT